MTIEIEAYDVIGESFASDIKQRLSKGRKDEPVLIAINSPGGLLANGVAAYSLLRRHKGPITTRVDGAAFSAATVLMLAGDERQVAANSLTLIHNPWMGSVPGEINELRKALDYLNKTKRSVINIYAERTGNSKDELAEAMEHETIFEGDEAVAAGFATEVIDAMSVEMSVDLDDLGLHATERLKQALAKRKVPMTQFEAAERLASLRARTSKLLSS